MCFRNFIYGRSTVEVGWTNFSFSMGVQNIKTYSKMSSLKLLVVNADDFGYGKERNIGIVECFLKGAVTSASVMINARYTNHAIDEARKYCIPLGRCYS